MPMTETAHRTPKVAEAAGTEPLRSDAGSDLPTKKLAKFVPHLSHFALRAASVAAAIGVWQMLAATDAELYVRFSLVPAPSEVFAAAAELASHGLIYQHISVSVQRVAMGFLLAVAVGIPLGMAIGRWRVGEDLLLPLVELVRPIPAVAWIPLAILLWPTQETSIIFIIFLAALFPIVLNTAQGVEGVPHQLVRAAAALGAKRTSVLIHVILPGSLPAIFAGLRVGIGIAWFGLIAAEIISGKFGIGYFTFEAYSLVNYDNIVVGMITIGLLGLLSSALIRATGSKVMRWQPRETRGA